MAGKKTSCWRDEETQNRWIMTIVVFFIVCSIRSIESTLEAQSRVISTPRFLSRERERKTGKRANKKNPKSKIHSEFITFFFLFERTNIFGIQQSQQYTRAHPRIREKKVHPAEMLLQVNAHEKENTPKKVKRAKKKENFIISPMK